MSSIGKKARILVIDDEEIVHASLKKILTRVGHEIQSAFSAKDGLQKSNGKVTAVQRFLNQMTVLLHLIFVSVYSLTWCLP